MYEFYDASRAPYLKTDASGVGLGAGLLQTRNGINCGHDEVPDNVIMCSTAFASKFLSSAEWYYTIVE